MPHAVSIAGATGYTGMKLLQLLRAHPEVGTVRVGARSDTGAALASRLPFLREAEGLTIEPLEELAVSPGDALFCCLPNGSASLLVKQARAAGAKVIDLGGDLRLKDHDARARWYPGAETTEAVYGLTELARDAIAPATVVANPGCYATAALLALAPLASAGILPPAPQDAPAGAGAVIIDAKSGVSGAGRARESRTQLSEMHDQISPYSAGRDHRHVAEIEQLLVSWTGHPQTIVFTPHLVPADRGVLASVYVPLVGRHSGLDLRALYARAYDREPFVRLLGDGALPDTRSVRGSNRCDIGLRWVSEAGILLVVAALDNLVKGAAGQAVQNFNLMFGVTETAGLPLAGDPL